MTPQSHSRTPQSHSLIGVLALQGAFREHIHMLQMCGARTREIRRPGDLEAPEGLDGLIIPGGESTTIGKLMVSYDLLGPIARLCGEGLPVFGTCAGLVMLAGDVVDGDQPLLGVMDIQARRNAFGRQVKSFESSLDVPVLGEQRFPAIFIRAPWIESAGPGVKLLASHQGHPVAARQDNLLVSAFHPELTSDPRLHQYFLRIVSQR